MFCLLQEIITLIAVTLIHIFMYQKLKLIAIDLSKPTILKDPQQINFIGKLLRNTRPTMIFIIEKSKETTFNFLENSVIII